MDADKYEELLNDYADAILRASEAEEAIERVKVYIASQRPYSDADFYYRTITAVLNGTIDDRG